MVNKKVFEILIIILFNSNICSMHLSCITSVKEKMSNFDDDALNKTCKLCEADNAKFSCPECRHVYYCSELCKDVDSEDHKEICKEIALKLNIPSYKKFKIDTKLITFENKDEDVLLPPNFASKLALVKPFDDDSELDIKYQTNKDQNLKTGTKRKLSNLLDILEDDKEKYDVAKKIKTSNDIKLSNLEKKAKDNMSLKLKLDYGAFPLADKTYINKLLNFIGFNLYGELNIKNLDSWNASNLTSKIFHIHHVLMAFRDLIATKVFIEDSNIMPLIALLENFEIFVNQQIKILNLETKKIKAIQEHINNLKQFINIHRAIKQSYDLVNQGKNDNNDYIVSILINLIRTILNYNPFKFYLDDNIYLAMNHELEILRSKIKEIENYDNLNLDTIKNKIEKIKNNLGLEYYQSLSNILRIFQNIKEIYLKDDKERLEFEKSKLNNSEEKREDEKKSNDSKVEKQYFQVVKPKNTANDKDINRAINGKYDIAKLIASYAVENEDYLSNNLDCFFACQEKLDNLKFCSTGKYIANSVKEKIAIIKTENNNGNIVSTGMKKVEAIEFSSNGKYMACSGKNSEDGIVEIRDLEKCDLNFSKTLKIIKDGKINAIKFSPNEKLIAAASLVSISIWDIENSKELKHLLFTENTNLKTNDKQFIYVTNLEFTSNGQYLAASFNTGVIKIWKIPEGNCIYEKKCHNSSIKRIIFSPNDNYLVSYSLEQNSFDIQLNKLLTDLKIWSISENLNLNLLINSKIPNIIGDIVYSNNGENLIISCGCEIGIWDLNNFNTRHYSCAGIFNDDIFSLTKIKNTEFLVVAANNKAILVCNNLADELNNYVTSWKNIYLAKLKEKITKRSGIWTSENDSKVKEEHEKKRISTVKKNIEIKIKEEDHKTAQASVSSMVM